MAENRISTRPPITRKPHRYQADEKIWSPDLSATQIPPICCRVYGEVCSVGSEIRVAVVGRGDVGGGLADLWERTDHEARW
jgi:hypothetical protein